MAYEEEEKEMILSKGRKLRSVPHTAEMDTSEGKTEISETQST